MIAGAEPEEPLVAHLTNKGQRMAEPTSAQRIEHIINTYIQACNDADAKAIAACFCPDAVHYGPGFSKWSGAATIGDNFMKRVQELGHCWTVDQVLVDVERCAAALEWTRFDRNARVVRGVDWFVFEPQTIRIREVRPYFAVSPRPDLARQEMQDFDYAGRGYPTNAPPR
jgi:SnoaL-like domain